MSGVEGLLLDPLLGVAGKTGKSLYKLVQKFRHAPKEFQELLDEVQQLRILISAVQNVHVEEDALPGLSGAVSKAKDKLLEIDSMVAYQLTKPLNVEEVNRATWARKSKDVKRLLEDLTKLMDKVTAHIDISNLARASSNASNQSQHFEALSGKLDQQTEQFNTFNVELSQLSLMTSTRHVANHNMMTLLGDQRQLLSGLFSQIEQSTETQRRLADCLEGFRAEESTLSLPPTSLSRLDSSATGRLTTSQSSKTVQSNFNGTLRLTAIRNTSTECLKSCRCACHKPQRFETPGPARRWIGSLQIHCSSISWLRPNCTVPKCKRTSRTSAVVQYTLPVWIASRMISAWYKSSPLSGPELLLRVPRLYSSGLHYYSQKGDIESVRELLSAGKALLHDLDPATGMNALTLALSHHQYEVSTFLLSHKADLQQEDFGGRSALNIALRIYLWDRRNGTQDASLEHFMDFDDAIDDAGFTPLHRIVCGLSSEDLQIKLQTHPELLDVVDNTGRSPLYWAAYLGNADAVHLLLEHGANIVLTSSNGSTALHGCFHSYGISKMILESEQAILDKGICNRRNKYGHCVWHLCDKGDILRLYMQHGCDLSLSDGVGQTAIHLAMDTDRDIHFSEALMAPELAKTDLHARGYHGWTTYELFDDCFPTEEDKSSPEGMARLNLLQYVEKLQNGGSDEVICEEERSDVESCDDESEDGGSYDEEDDEDGSSENESDEDIFEDAIDHI